MVSTTVRIPIETRKILTELSAETGRSQQDILSAAVESYRRNRIVEQANSAYAALKNDPAAWNELLQERAEWDSTLADDLDDE